MCLGTAKKPSKSTLASQKDLRLLPAAEVGHRSKREGFPALSAEPLAEDAIKKRRDFLANLSSAGDSGSKPSVSGKALLSNEELVTFGTIVLDYVEALASARSGACPTITELAANLAHDPRIGHVNSAQFEATVRVLLSHFFRK